MTPIGGAYTNPNLTGSIFTAPTVAFTQATAQMQALQGAVTQINQQIAAQQARIAQAFTVPMKPPIWAAPLARYPEEGLTVPKDIPRMWSPEPIEAWRQWDLMQREPGWWVLTPRHANSMRENDTWLTEEAVAICGRRNSAGEICKQPPGEDHDFPGCGLYAVKREEAHLLLPPDPWFVGKLGMPPIVLGKVLLSGKVIEYEKGYRAEKAKIDLVFLPFALPPEVRTSLELGYPTVRFVAYDELGRNAFNRIKEGE